ncbi:MAG: IS5 family transposase [Methylomicrobium sp.]
MTQKKRRYKLKNWRAYNESLVNRGSLTLWFEASQIERWHQPERSGYRGRAMTYSDMATQCGLTIRELFQLPLRSTEGFLKSLVKLLGVVVQVPDYSTLCRRQQTLAVALPRPVAQKPRHLIVDSTGLKVYGEGEWKVRQHGIGKRRTWRKLHIAVDAQTQEVVAVELTANFVGDAEVLPDLLEQLNPEEALASVAADGAYDTVNAHDAIRKKQGQALIPPRAGAVAWSSDEDGTPHPRTVTLRACQEKGEAEWKRISGYHRRSLAETTMFRIKALFSQQLKNRTFAAQQAETYLRVGALNKMTGLGLPDSYPVS